MKRTAKIKKIPSHEKLRRLCVELDAELDGVRVPATAAAILNGIRAVLSDIEWEQGAGKRAKSS